MKKYLLFALMMIFATQANASVQDLLNAVKEKDAVMLTKLLSEGEDANGKNDQGNTALHYAVAMDNAELTSALLANGADVNIANSKGWTPLKIAEKKQAKNVMPLLLNAQKTGAKTAVAKVQKVANQTKSAVAEKTKKSAAEVQQQTQKVKQEAQQVAQQVVSEAQVEMVPLAEAQAVIAQREAVAKEALQAKAQAEEKVKALEAQVKELEKVKTEAQNAAKAAQQTAKAATATATVTAATPTKQQTAAAKPAQKAPVKKLPPQKSKFSDKIFAGDEDIVYCLNYLGQGEDQHFLEAAVFFAASAGINEKRYNEIIEISNDYFSHISEEELKVRYNECSRIITPANKDKMNQIVRSINKALGL